MNPDCEFELEMDPLDAAALLACHEQDLVLA
jgi:hypothetical protein